MMEGSRSTEWRSRRKNRSSEMGKMRPKFSTVFIQKASIPNSKVPFPAMSEFPWLPVNRNLSSMGNRPLYQKALSITCMMETRLFILSFTAGRTAENLNLTKRPKPCSFFKWLRSYECQTRRCDCHQQSGNQHNQSTLISPDCLSPDWGVGSWQVLWNAVGDMDTSRPSEGSHFRKLRGAVLAQPKPDLHWVFWWLGRGQFLLC